MKHWTVWTSVGVVGLAGLGATAAWYAFSPPIGKFSYPAPDVRGLITYACELRASAEESEANALAAHKFYVAAINDLAKAQGAALYGNVSDYVRSPDALHKLDALHEMEKTGATIKADRKSLAKEMRRRFDCRHING